MHNTRTFFTIWPILIYKRYWPKTWSLYASWKFWCLVFLIYSLQINQLENPSSLHCNQKAAISHSSEVTHFSDIQNNISFFLGFFFCSCMCVSSDTEMGVPMIKFPIFMVVRGLGIVITAILLIWTVHYRGGLALISDNKDLIFNVISSLFCFYFVVCVFLGKVEKQEIQFRLVYQLLGFVFSLMGCFHFFGFY